jgi:hypothetical protein
VTAEDAGPAVKRAAGWILPALAVAVLVGGTAWTLVVAYERGKQTAAGSTHRSDASGARALFLLLEEMGHRPVRWTRPQPPRGALLVSVEPESASDERENDLLTWVHEGGTLVIAAGPATGDEASRLPWSLGLTAAERPGGPRWWSRRPPSARVLRGTEAEPVVVDYHHGLGRVIALAEPRWLENAGLSQEDHLDLALEAVLGPGLPIHFDEYRHGLRERPGLAYVLHRYGLLPAAFAGLCFLGLVVWRTTPAAAERPAEEEAWGAVRDSLVEARAHLYARSLRPRDAAGLLERELRRELSSFLGSGALLPWKEVQRRVQERRPARAATLRSLASELSALRSKPPAQLAELVPVSRRVADFLKELR